MVINFNKRKIHNAQNKARNQNKNLKNSFRRIIFKACEAESAQHTFVYVSNSPSDA